MMKLIFCHELLLIDRHGASLGKSQLPKVLQPGRLFGELLRPLMRLGLPLVKNVPKIIAKKVCLYH